MSAGILNHINRLIDDAHAEAEISTREIAERALNESGDDTLSLDDVKEFVRRVFLKRWEPWNAENYLPVARPIGGKPSIKEMLVSGYKRKEGINETVLAILRMHPNTSESQLGAEITAWGAWLRECGQKQKQQAEALGKYIDFRQEQEAKTNLRKLIEKHAAGRSADDIDAITDEVRPEAMADEELRDHYAMVELRKIFTEVLHSGGED